MKLEVLLMKTLAAILLLCLQGCYVLRFDNGPMPQASELSSPHAEWHHIGIIKMVEFSDPVDLQQRCQGREWSSVTTRLNFIQGLIGAIPYNYFYSPCEVEFVCRK